MAQQFGSSSWGNKAPEYKVYNEKNFHKLPQFAQFDDEEIHAIRVVASVLPFKCNNYVVENLIRWNDPHDAIFRLTFPHRGMLLPHHFNQMDYALKQGDKKNIRTVANKIRLELNPHPAGQCEENVPKLKDGTKLRGIQHKYSNTILFFPSQGQTCHAYCTFCFRWPQFVGMSQLKFAMKEADLLVQYLREHPEVTDVIFTGGDPMVMSSRVLEPYLRALISAKLPSLQSIRIGSKSLSYWPHRFLSDRDSEDVLNLFSDVADSGIHLAFMAHFNHYAELETEAAQLAIEKITASGANIRSQSPILRYINDSTDVWVRMWEKQVQLGVVPYYMFAVRDTGAQHYFSVPLVRAARIFRRALRQVGGLGRTVRGPSMSCSPGKIEVLGESEILGEQVLALRMIQGRDSEVDLPTILC